MYGARLPYQVAYKTAIFVIELCTVIFCIMHFQATQIGIFAAKSSVI
jgi:hypothetical protein